MEDVLDLYAEPYDAQRPVVCFDELPYQLLHHVVAPQAYTPGRVAREEYEYACHGTCNLFMLFQPQQGWRHVALTARRTAHDFAHQMQTLVDEQVPQAAVIRVVLDNLNTLTPAALYQTFAPAEARRLTEKLEFHYTPQARELAQHGRDRVVGVGAAMFRSALARPGSGCRRGCAVGSPAKCVPRHGGLALYGAGCTHETGASVHIGTLVADY